MQAHRFRLVLDGPFGTRPTSGTLAGQLVWAAAEAGVLEFVLEAQKAGRLRLSDALPEDRLPRPLLPPDPAPRPADPEAADATKRERKLPFVDRERFLARRGRFDHAALAACLVRDEPASPEVRIAHNTIDRRRGTTPEEGGLFFMDEWWPKGDERRRDLYLQSDLDPALLADLLARIGGQGFGRDATTGRGRFRVEGHAPETRLLAHAGNRFVSLSHGSLTPAMVDARWRLWAHFGKLGAAALAKGARPWKRPVLLCRPGCTFAAADPLAAGAWLEGLHQDAERLGFEPGLNAWHLAVPYTETAA